MSALFVVRLAVVLLCVAAARGLGFGTSCQATTVPGRGEARFRQDRFLIQPKPGATAALIDFHRALGVTVLRTFPASGGLVSLSVPAGETVTNLVARYTASGLVQFAEPTFQVHAACAPDDPQLVDGTQWGLMNTGRQSGTPCMDIDAVAAWSKRSAATNVIVAVVDTGVRYSHEDLTANLWTNATGAYGTNAILGTLDPWDDNGHGTQMTGIIGAVGNNSLGVCGVAWEAQIMSCKSLDESGFGFIDDAIACFEYARANGAKIINLSWGATDLTIDGTNYAQSLSNAIVAAAADNVIFVAAAGNTPAGSALDTDVTPFYPASFPMDNIIAVAASTPADELATFSNFGATNVDLAAPGVGIWTTVADTDNSYGFGGSGIGSGTSEATAMVCGALALVWSEFPGDSVTQVVQRLISTADPQPSLAGKCVSGGRLNLRDALGVPASSQPTVEVLCVPPLTVNVHGTACSAYVLEASTNLVDWVAVTTNLTSPAGVLPYLPEPDVVPEQFFRAYAKSSMP